ncbi:ATP-binding cassette domain-containing protein [Fusobacterium ulcerans]|jgi:predicted ATP-binding protein involved in virulence|uniref:AAA family ATPase n=1 Tax=Fusobacterium ulcerans TaxID=861 RepID=UPI000E52E0C6|nr:AAA family ATPase [Fusobacterium ulcerans]RGY63048.1 ATP-binding cassette domain-containing protein [Fusobacterium ulcerans]
MKIKSIEIKNNKALKNININFEKENEILNTIVIAGSNGSGKTTLLECIYSKMELISKKWTRIEGIELILEKDELQFIEYLGRNKINTIKNEMYKIVKNEIPIFPKVIYIPSEVKFKNLNTKTVYLKLDYNFLNIIDSSIVDNIPSYIASRITYLANTEENLTMREVKEEVNSEINRIFEILELDVKLTGLSKDERSMPVFTNSSGEEFDINQLSSGEKQLFLRTLAIKMLEPENSIILIDEPELSLHPKWQQRIIEIYQRIGKNNQIIVATHSPHILGSVPRENIILLSKNENGEVVSTTGEELYTSYGQPVDRILEDIMGLETTRNPKVFDLLNEVRKLVDENQYETNNFKEKYSELKSILGETDKDLFLIDMDIQRKRRKE